MNWEPHASALAAEVSHVRSRWTHPVAKTPRHLFIPRWWERTAAGYRLAIPKNLAEWYGAAYADRSLITRVGHLHADDAKEHDEPTGLPTSSATHPSLVLKMLRFGMIDSGDHMVYVGTGSGYGPALATRRLSSQQVTGVDVDSYLVDSARVKLDSLGLSPSLHTADATGPLPVDSGSADRIVSMVSVRTIPVSWLDALCVGGRLVTTIAGTSLIVTAEKNRDGGASGRVEWDRAGFMHARHGNDYPPLLSEQLKAALWQEGEVSTGRYPVVDVEQAWDLHSMLDLTAPGIEHRYTDNSERRTALMTHADGSWARATAIGTEQPAVHQGGPRRLWDILDEIRTDWLARGELPARGARVVIKPDGRTILARGNWRTEVK